MSRETISIILTTYNGEQYIVEQLDSIRLQSISPDEVIIYDDCSCDATVSVITEYICKYQLSNWTLYQGKTNVGWIENFHRATKLATGDYIFFSDQDDVWNLGKIEKMIIAMKNENISVLSCKCAFIDTNGNHISVSKESIPFGKKCEKYIIKHKLDDKFTYSIFPGCTMCVRRKFVDAILSTIDKENLSKIPHDALYWKMGVLLDSAYEINDELIMYRIHNNNASKPLMKSSFSGKRKSARLNEIEKTINDIIFFKTLYVKNTKYENYVLEKLERIIDFHMCRILFIKGEKGGLKVLSGLKCYRNLKMFLGDLYSKTVKR